MAKPKYFLIAITRNKKQTFIASGINSYKKTHPLQKHFAKLANEPHKIYLHAEIKALLASKDYKIDTLQIRRLTSNNETALAAPCNTCLLACKAYGVKYINYTTGKNGQTKTQTLNELLLERGLPTT